MGKPIVRPIFIPQFSSHEEARQVLSQSLQDLQRSVLGSLPVTSYDGSRISNVGIPQYTDDVVTLGYLRSVLVPGVNQSFNITNAGGTSTSANGESSLFPIFPSGGVFGPNLNFGLVQFVALSSGGPYTISAPVGVPPFGVRFWTLVIQQDATGGRVANTDSSYIYNANLLGAALPNTWSICPMVTKGNNGHSFLDGVPITDQPIP